ncbi:MAG: polymer-forming cytoskeletal protein [Deltaproteobacteria bacterium]|nr:polymer-forming cytoskeletal protein [Deltaproteobacteria bacterium]
MASTIIGSSIVINGEIAGDDDLLILGTVKGRITLKDALIVERSGIVEADIESTAVAIGGQVTGNILATERVELQAEGRMVGDIRSPRILIADGASFKGNIDMDI